MLLHMKSMDRRRFLALTAATAATLPGLRGFAHAAPLGPLLGASLGTSLGTSLGPSLGSTQGTPQGTATLTVHADGTGAHVPKNFIGLSYETNQLADPTFFKPSNIALIQQFRALSPNGVLRIGGNTSDIGWWKATPESRQPAIQVRDSGGGEPTSALAYPVTPEAVHNLRAFLEAAGWSCIYGINLGTNTPARAADEAAVVAQVLGPKLEYFQLGNEPDLFDRHLRDPRTWSADRYMDEWLAEADAIRARVPGARFGLPDTSGSPDWYAVIVTRLLALRERPDVAALTHHYYIGGPPSNPQMTIGYILTPKPRVAQLAHDIRAAADRLSAGEHRTVPYRMTEGNTCYRGGKPGVSDTFASALWAADYLLELANFGYAGVNLHGGDGKAVGNSLGGHLPGDDLVLAQHGDPSQHPHPYYTPIGHIGDAYVAEPVSYGMRFAGHFAGARMVPVDFDPGGVNATAYAAKTADGGMLVAVINKDATQPLAVDLKGYRAVLALTAPALDATHAGLGPVAAQAGVSGVPAGSAMLFRSA